MQHTIPNTDSEFEVVLGNERSQAAIMVLPPHGSTGKPHNEHAGSDQWLYVLEGEGEAIIDEKKINLTQGSLLLVEQREQHSIRNTGSAPLRTLNFYVPPGYRPDGEPISS